MVVSIVTIDQNFTQAMPGSGTAYAHTWGGCWRKEGDFWLEYFPEGLILSRDCPNQIKWHDTFSFVVLNVFGEFHKCSHLLGLVTHCAKPGDVGYL